MNLYSLGQDVVELGGGHVDVVVNLDFVRLVHLGQAKNGNHH